MTKEEMGRLMIAIANCILCSDANELVDSPLVSLIVEHKPHGMGYIELRECYNAGRNGSM